MTGLLTPSSDAQPMVPVLAVVGVGLIGGSFAGALKAAGAAGQVLGVGRHAATLSRAQSLGLIDQAVTLEQALERADVIMLATPVGVMAPLLQAMQPLLRKDTVVTDAGSTKSDVVSVARDVLGDKLNQFVPGHPIAGAEQAGPDSADAELYRKRTVVLTPIEETSADALQQVSALWELCGARVLTMTAQTHDAILASVSHVPHFLSSVFMWQVATADDSDARLSLAGSGFRDFTRIAAGSPEVWRDIFLANRTAILAELDQIKHSLTQAEQALQDSDGQALLDFLETAASARQIWGSRNA